MRSLIHTIAALTVLIVIAGASHAQATDTSLSYFDPNLDPVYFSLPGTFGTTSGSDVARTIVAYSERFTSPWPVTYVKGVTVAIKINRLDNGAVIPIELRKATTIKGLPFADFSAAPLERDTIGASMVQSGKSFYEIPFGQQPVDPTFFVTVSAPDTANTRAMLKGDAHVDSAITMPAHAINDSDRAQFYLDGPYHDTIAWYMAGTQWPSMPGVYDYSNFVILADVFTPTGGVAELYPASSDPLAYFVERTAGGELVLHYTLKDAALATITLYDTRGVQVGTLLSEHESSGSHELHLADAFAHGMYYAKLTANGVTEVRPLAIAR
jgi:hypothetical protein